MWYLFSYLIMGYAGTGYSVSQQIVPNLTEQQCKQMKSDIVEMYTQREIEAGQRNKMLGIGTDYILECRRMEK